MRLWPTRPVPISKIEDASNGSQVSWSRRPYIDQSSRAWISLTRHVLYSWFATSFCNGVKRSLDTSDTQDFVVLLKVCRLSFLVIPGDTFIDETDGCYRRIARSESTARLRALLASSEKHECSHAQVAWTMSSSKGLHYSLHLSTTKTFSQRLAAIDRVVCIGNLDSISCKDLMHPTLTDPISPCWSIFGWSWHGPMSRPFRQDVSDAYNRYLSSRPIATIQRCSFSRYDSLSLIFSMPVHPMLAHTNLLSGLEYRLLD